MAWLPPVLRVKPDLKLPFLSHSWIFAWLTTNTLGNGIFCGFPAVTAAPLPEYSIGIREKRNKIFQEMMVYALTTNELKKVKLTQDVNYLDQNKTLFKYIIR